jgi:competence protein ComEC
VLTHFHVDHAGGVTGALPGRGSPPLLVSPLAEPADEVRRVVAASVRPLTPVTTSLAGQVGAGASVVRWRVFPPPASALTAASTGDDPQGTEVNNASIVLLAETHGLRLMALGDVEPEAQRPLLRSLRSLAASGPAVAGSPAVGPVDVVVVAHHGSARQTPALYEFLRPRVGFIGVGAGNDYGHPAPSTLAVLRHLGIVTVRTDTQGWLAVSGTSARLRVATHR